jgi:DNA-binding MarR family transcriptional regulator
MKFIADHTKPKMKDLADYLSITAPSATALINELVKDGFVACTADKSDRRASRLALTMKGKTELKKAITRGMKLLGGLFSGLSKTELTAFTHALEHIRKTVK